jgi:hypothetical protein
MCVVPISLTKEEILNNAGSNQIRDVMRTYIQAAEIGLREGMEASLFSDGTGFGGKELGGLNLAVPITPTNLHGGIDRPQYHLADGHLRRPVVCHRHRHQVQLDHHPADAQPYLRDS